MDPEDPQVHHDSLVHQGCAVGPFTLQPHVLAKGDGSEYL